MKKVKILFLCVSLVICCKGIGWSYPILNADTMNSLLFTNREQWVDLDNSQSISVNDIFYGILAVQDVQVGNSMIWTHDDTPPGLDSFTGYFLTKVTNVVFPVNGSPQIYLGAANADSNGVLSSTELGNGVLMKLFTDTTTAFNDSLPGGIAAATDGTAWATYGLGTNGYWYTVAPVNPPASGFVGTSYLGLNLVKNDSGYLFNKVNDPVEGVVNTDVDMYAKSYIYVDTVNPGQFVSQDPAAVEPVIPEPSSMLLLGMGLLGVVPTIRRKKVA